jgi:hypothetical protein
LIVLAVAVLTGCADPTEHRPLSERDNARLKVIADAAFYYGCTRKVVQAAGECRPWREAYEKDYASFMAKYGSELLPPIR